jgi:dTDP-glucose 4,6-dehydratase
MKLLVTGGAGFIGSNFIHLLFRDNARMLSDGGFDGLVNLDKLTYAGNPNNFRDLAGNPKYVFVQADIGDREVVSTLLEKENIGAVVHFAAESHVDRSIDSPEPFFIANVLGTLRLLDCARLYWKKLPAEKAAAFRFLHVSTDEVYGSLGPADPPFEEATPYAPNSPYSASKASSDFIVRSYFHTYGMPVVTTNCSNNYGPFQFPEKLIPLMILNAQEGKPLPIYGDGKNVRDWLYVEDHCRGIALVLSKGILGQTYNIGGMNEQPNIAIVDGICELLDGLTPRKDGRSYKEQKTFVKDRPGHDRRYSINCSKICRELGWKPLENFKSGIEKTVRWYLDNKNWCADITSKRYQRQRLGL